MSMTDPIADMLTRVRNAHSVGKPTVSMPSSKKLVEIARIMQEEGYIQGFEIIDGEPRATLEITMKYGPKRPRPSAALSAFPSLVCASTPARTTFRAFSAASVPQSSRLAKAL